MKSKNDNYSYFLVRPGRNSDARVAARKLLMLRQIKEVTVTEGEYGFVRGQRTATFYGTMQY